MMILLSPAKIMTGNSQVRAPFATKPLFVQEASDIIMQMAQFRVNDLRSILKLNPAMALESYCRFQEFHSEDNVPLQAILTYAGTVYRELNPKDFTEKDYLFSQENLRIVSICYGLLRPLDLIKPYRMEYDVKLPELGDGNMYIFWRNRLTDVLIEQVNENGGLLINLASSEVRPAFDWMKVKKAVRIITPEFKVFRDGKLKTIVIYAKMARGQMTRFIIKNKITDPEELKNFYWEGFSYNESLSTENRWTFVQE